MDFGLVTVELNIHVTWVPPPPSTIFSDEKLGTEYLTVDLK